LITFWYLKKTLKNVNPFFFLQETEECPDEQISFEMVTGYVYTAPADMLDSQVSNDFRFLKKFLMNSKNGYLEKKSSNGLILVLFFVF
jgi:hypothetical protein